MTYNPQHTPAIDLSSAIAYAYAVASGTDAQAMREAIIDLAAHAQGVQIEVETLRARVTAAESKHAPHIARAQVTANAAIERARVDAAAQIKRARIVADSAREVAQLRAMPIMAQAQVKADIAQHADSAREDAQSRAWGFTLACLIVFAVVVARMRGMI